MSQPLPHMESNKQKGTREKGSPLNCQQILSVRGITIIHSLCVYVCVCMRVCTCDSVCGECMKFYVYSTYSLLMGFGILELGPINSLHTCPQTP